MIVTGFDSETNHKDPKQAQITELGAILFDVSPEGVWIPLDEGLSLLVYDESYPPQSEEIIRVTGITDDILKISGIPPKEALEKFFAYAGQGQFLVAYNAEFDRDVLFHEMARQGLPPIPPERYLCAMNDVKYAEHFKCRKQSHLALDHGITVDPASLHRSIGDIRLMGQLLTRVGATIESMTTMARDPWLIVKAEVSFADKDKAKARRYFWEKIEAGGKTHVLAKSWIKRIKKADLTKERAEAGFNISVLAEGV